MDYRKKFRAEPGARVKLNKIDPDYKGKQVSKKSAESAIEKHCGKLESLQQTLYAEKKHSLLVVVQALDAGGKDGTINHVMGVLNPQGTKVTSFKEPNAQELAHDFLWRVHPHAPARDWIGIFNRSHYEDVLISRVHHLVPNDVVAERYESINDFEPLLRKQNNTNIVNFFRTIIWDDYMSAYEEVFERTSKKNSPWYIIPSNHKWFRNLAVSQILTATMEELGMTMPKPTVDLEAIRERYHQEQEAAPKTGRHGAKESQS